MAKKDEFTIAPAAVIIEDHDMQTAQTEEITEKKSETVTFLTTPETMRKIKAYINYVNLFGADGSGISGKPTTNKILNAAVEEYLERHSEQIEKILKITE